MPELPEIETLRRSLSGLCGREVARLKFSRLAPIETTSAAQIRRYFLPAQIHQLKRHGKYLLLENQGGVSLVIHLGMSGKLRFFSEPKKVSPAKHRHLWIGFTDGTRLELEDPRRFGTISLSRKPDFSDNPFLNRLGPDFLDLKLSGEDFVARCRRHPKLSLKNLLLHQGVAAGLGNIYACEALYGAGLDPRRLVKDTEDAALIRLLESARRALSLGIRYGGVSMRDYVDGNGHRGVMKEFLQVYDREGETTLDGRGRVERIVQSARSTWFSPQVQK